MKGPGRRMEGIQSTPDITSHYGIRWARSLMKPERRTMQEGRRLIYTFMHLVLYNVMEGESVPTKHAKTILLSYRKSKGIIFIPQV